MGFEPVFSIDHLDIVGEMTDSHIESKRHTIIHGIARRAISTRLVPDTDSEDEPRVVHSFSRLSYKRRGFSKFARIGESYVRAKFAAEFIAEPQSSIDVGKTGAAPPP